MRIYQHYLDVDKLMEVVENAHRKLNETFAQYKELCKHFEGCQQDVGGSWQ
jgi:hypothetical protein